jgi:hypothetical protein
MNRDDVNVVFRTTGGEFDPNGPFWYCVIVRDNSHFVDLHGGEYEPSRGQTADLRGYDIMVAVLEQIEHTKLIKITLQVTDLKIYGTLIPQ